MIVALQGGLGNQLFQYAFGLSMSESRNEPLYLDTNRATPERPYMLDAYADLEFRNVTEPIVQEHGHGYNSTVMDAPIGASFVGYWQSEKYFDEDAVRLAMAAPRGPIPDHVLSMGAEIASSPNPCFVGIRRGDNLSPRALSFHGLLPLEYHTVGMSMVRDRHPDVKFYIFSDDPEWCKQTFPDETVVEGNLAQPWWDIWLMSLCKNAVIPNSTFSWWGCWLGEVHENRTIICPKRWFVGHADARDICPERWIKL